MDRTRTPQERLERNWKSMKMEMAKKDWSGLERGGRRTGVILTGNRWTELGHHWKD